MALLADSELPWVQIKYNRIANKAIRIRHRRKSTSCQTWVGSPLCLWDRIHLTSNGPVPGMGSNIGNRHLQAPGGTERVTARPSSLHWSSAVSLCRKNLVLGVHVP